MIVFVLFCSDAISFGDYYLGSLIMAYICLYSGHEEENSAKRRFANIFNIIMNPSKSCGVVSMIFVQVDLILVLRLGIHLVDPRYLVA